MENQYHHKCTVCNTENYKKLSGYEKFHLVKCNKCHFVFTSKIPSEQELIEFYKGYGRDDYLSPITIKRYQELLDEFEKYKKTGNLLDVGSGIGYFLEEAKKRGWKVYGTEYTDEAIEICEKKGITMHKGVLNPKNYNVEFDVITSFEVIEHINNPQEEIKNISSILSKGGLFYLTTPNFNSWSSRNLKSNWQQIHYPEHLSYYTVQTLSFLLSNFGLQPVKKLTTGISVSLYKKSKGANIETSIAEDSDDEMLRRKMEKNPLLGVMKTIINSLLSLFRLGDTIKLYAVKK